MLYIRLSLLARRGLHISFNQLYFAILYLWCGVNRKCDVLAASHDTILDVVSQLLAGFHVAVEQVMTYLCHVCRFVKHCGKPSGLCWCEVHLGGEAQQFLFTKKHSQSHKRLSITMIRSYQTRRKCQAIFLSFSSVCFMPSFVMMSQRDCFE